MLIKVRPLRGQETLVGLDHVMAIVDQGSERLIRFAPDASPTDEARLLVENPLSAFGNVGAFVPVNLLSPHDAPQPALVNMSLVALAMDCQEGTLLRFTGRSGAKLLVDAKPTAILALQGGLGAASPAL